MIDKKDSAYGVFGELEIYTKKDIALRAVNLLKKAEL
jgi:hypothetical protein